MLSLHENRAVTAARSAHLPGLKTFGRSVETSHEHAAQGFPEMAITIH